MRMMEFTKDMKRAILRMRDESGMGFGEMERQVGLTHSTLAGWLKVTPDRIHMSNFRKLFKLIDPYMCDDIKEDEAELFELDGTEAIADLAVEDAAPPLIAHEVEVDMLADQRLGILKASTMSIMYFEHLKWCVGKLVEATDGFFEACRTLDMNQLDSSMEKMMHECASISAFIQGETV